MAIWDENLVIIIMLVLCQKLHIYTYNRQNFSGDWLDTYELSIKNPTLPLYSVNAISWTRELKFLSM